MKKKWVTVGIILLFVGVTIAPSINFNTVEASQQNLINERINQKELLFQTIVDIANNKEIQRIILKSQISRGISPISEFPVVTKSQLRVMYLLGLMLSRFIHTSRMQSMIGKYQFSHQTMQNEISAVIKKDATLDSEVTQIINSDCDCDYEQISSWGFPIFCSILNVLMIIPLILFVFGSSLGALGLWFRLIGLIGYVLELITVPIIYGIIYVGTIFDCNWWFITP